MQPKPMVVIAKHSIVITPALFDLALSHARFFIHDRQTKLAQYLRDRGSYRVQPENAPEPSAALQSEIKQAEALVQAVEPAKDDLVRIYELNFQTHAEILRSARIHLGQEKIENMYSLKVVLGYTMQMLKGMNPTFSSEKFIEYINEGK